ncbi:MAG: CBS domain-containing protein [Proteobacteria bacterium]|nr:CBS domain-containing protein [Pseudomonadota bacterium]
MTQDKKITKTQELVYKLKVKDVMTTDIVTVSPGNTMNELKEILRIRRIAGTPVVENKRLVGVIGIDDLIRCLSEGEMDATVGEKMTRKVEVLYGDEPLAHAVNKFNQYGFGRFPVIERKRGRLIGILTKSDMVTGLLKRLEIAYHTEEFRHNNNNENHVFNNIVMDKTSFHFQYRVNGQDFKVAGESIYKLKQILSQLGFPPPIIRRATIAAYEAEMNIIIYSYGGCISVSADYDHITLEARDTGPGIANIEQAMRQGFSTAPTWVQELGFGAGMGLPNIRKCADTMDIESEVGKGTHIKIVIKNTNGNGK